MKSLIEFMQEQDIINYRRSTGESPPWSDDPVMTGYKFGNVRRELDRTNRLLHHLFVKEKWADKCPVLEGKPILVANCLVHRLVSCHDFSERHGLFTDFKAFNKRYKQDRLVGLPVRPTSFISCKSDQDLLKSAELCFSVTSALAEVLVDSQSLESAFYNFKKIVGKFTAWQAALDCVMHGWVSNLTDFVHLGPGAEFTLRALDLDASSYMSLVADINQQIAYLPLRYEEVEGLLCEYGRYIKYNTKWPGKYRNYTPDQRPLIPVSLDSTLRVALKSIVEN